MGDQAVTHGGCLWSIIFYECDCGARKAELRVGSWQIEDLT